MRTRIRSTFGLLAILALSACGDNPLAAILPTEIEIRNSTSSAIVGVFISPCTSDSWGANKLTDQIAPGQNRRFGVSPGCYDVAAVTQDQREVEFSAIEVTQGQTYQLTVTN